MPKPDALNAESRQTVRQAGGLALQRAVLIASAVASASLIPRAMGAEIYGQFALIHSMSLWFALLNGMGAVSMMTRFVPDFVERQDWDGLRRLTGGMLALRSSSGLLSCLVYFALTTLWLRDLDPMAIAFVALSVALRTAANLPFTLLLGLNQASRWGAADLLRHALHAPLVFAGYQVAGLRGACATLPLTELVVLTLGLWWIRSHLSLGSLWVDREFLKPFVRFSVGFLLSNLLIVLFDRGGAPLVHWVSGRYADAGFYTLATSAYLMAAGTVWRMLSAFGPLLSGLRSRGEVEALRQWVEGILKVLAVGSVAGAAFTYTCGAWTLRWIVGPGYEEAAPLLPTVALAGIALGPGAVARLLAVCYGQPRSTIVAAALQAALFAVLSLFFIPRFGTQGAAVSLVLAVALFAAYGTWRMRQAFPYSLRPWGFVVLLGVLSSPPLWVWPAAGILPFGAFLAIFALLLAGFRIFSGSELRALCRRHGKE